MTTLDRLLQAARHANGRADLWAAVADRALAEHRYANAQLFLESAEDCARVAGRALGTAYRAAGLMSILAILQACGAAGPVAGYPATAIEADPMTVIHCDDESPTCCAVRIDAPEVVDCWTPEASR